MSISKDEIRRLLIKLSKKSLQNFARVELKSKSSELSFNIIMRIVCSKRYFGLDEDEEHHEAKLFRDLIEEAFKYAGASNPGDFLPLLMLIDYQNYGLIEEHRGHNKDSNTMIDHMLSLQQSQPEYYTNEIIKGITMALLNAGTGTSALTMEWALSRFLNNPEVLEKARAELETQVGTDRIIEEHGLANLFYLHNIILETF
ncbi:isoflavone 2'-hydroxylase-like [Coffea eugenioides]|uniref:isoflavone 2'-hydroxylase-like n=1 Tax=Coffea eugenioides TaxID=49369 RepID=UPI000F610474|nr:isoflavone 2'-hydroxylase-like [Coffea eugenioides]